MNLMVGYIKSLDSLRALAIILVILFHFNFALEAGWIGVQIFFVLSGYLITSILLKSKELPFDHYVRRFFWRRSLRIFPLYFLYLLLAFFVFLISRQPEDFLSKFPYLLSYTFNFYPLINGYDYDGLFTHMWSLAVEEQFYLIWPFVVFLLTFRQLQKTLVAIIILTPVLRLIMGEVLTFHDEKELGEIIYRLTFIHFDAFAVGGAIPLFQLREKIKYKGAVFCGLTILTVAVGMINFFYLPVAVNPVSLSSIGFPVGGMENYQHVWSYSILNFWTCSFILFIADPAVESKNWLIRILESPVLIFIGKISYGMYIFHWAILVLHKKFINDYIGNSFLSFTLYFGLVVAVSYMSFILFEKKFLVWKDFKFHSLAITHKQK